MQNTGKIFTISGPSGTGKDSIAKQVVKNCPNFEYFITATTRNPREGEVDGKHYHFITKEEFLEGVKSDKFIEWIEYHGNYYGTLKSAVLTPLEQGRNVISAITCHGVKALKKFAPNNVVSILIMPPSFDALVNRINERSVFSNESKADIALRLSKVKIDLEKWQNDPEYKFKNPDLSGMRAKDFDHVVINDVWDETLEQVYNIVNKK